MDTVFDPEDDFDLCECCGAVTERWGDEVCTGCHVAGCTKEEMFCDAATFDEW